MKKLRKFGIKKRYWRISLGILRIKNKSLIKNENKKKSILE